MCNTPVMLRDTAEEEGNTCVPMGIKFKVTHFNPLPLLIADEIGGVPVGLRDTAGGESQNAVQKKQMHSLLSDSRPSLYL